MAEPEAPEGTWPKFSAPATQLEREKKLTAIQLTGLQKEKETVKWLQEQIDPRSNVEAGIKDSYKKQLALIRRKQTERAVEAEFGKDFRKWLQGQSEYNVVHYTDMRPGTGNDDRPVPVKRLCTPWGNKDLTKLPGVADFLDTGITGRAQTIQDLTTLRMKGPTDINDAYIYYKYIVRGFGIDGDAVHEMDEFSHYLSPPPAGYQPDPDGGEPIPMAHDRDLEDGPGPLEDYSNDVFIPWNQTDQRAKYYAKFTEENRAAASKRVTIAIESGIPPAEVDLNLVDERTYVHARYEKLLSDIKAKPLEERDDYINSFYYEMSEHIDMGDVVGNDFFEPHLASLRRMGDVSLSPVTGHGSMANDPEMQRLMKNRRRSFALEHNAFGDMSPTSPPEILVDEEKKDEEPETDLEKEIRDVEEAVDQSMDELNVSFNDLTEEIENMNRLPPYEPDLFEFGDVAADVIDIENELFSDTVFHKIGITMTRLVAQSLQETPETGPEAFGLYAAVQRYQKEIRASQEEFLQNEEYADVFKTIHNSNVFNLTGDKDNKPIGDDTGSPGIDRFSEYIATLIDEYRYISRNKEEQLKQFAGLFTQASDFIGNTKGSTNMDKVITSLADDEGNPHPIMDVIVARATQMMISGEGDFDKEKLKTAKRHFTEGNFDNVTNEDLDQIAYALSRGGLPMKMAYSKNIQKTMTSYQLKKPLSPRERMTLLKEAFFHKTVEGRANAVRMLMGYKKEYENVEEF